MENGCWNGGAVGGDGGDGGGHICRVIRMFCLAHSVRKFIDSTPVCSRWSRPLINIHLSIYIGTDWVLLSIFLKIELHRVIELELECMENILMKITIIITTRMWANAQRDGHPAKHRWHPLFNAAKFGWRPLLDCRAVMLSRHESRWNLQGCPRLVNRSQPLVGNVRHIVRTSI